MAFQFQTWQAFLSMGGYGAYVWAAYGALLLTLFLGIWTPWQQNKALKKGNLQSPTVKSPDTFIAMDEPSQPLI